MKVLVVASEVVPFAKTGGLADVAGALPVELERLGHEPIVIMPAYQQAKAGKLPIEDTGLTFTVPIGTKNVAGRILKSTLPDSTVPVYLIDHDEYFSRPELYTQGGKDYPDNCERFTFFCRGVMEAIRLFDWQLDVVHLNDWQTGLVAAYFKTEYRGVPGYERPILLFTIHNLAYQGTFWHWDMLLTGLDWKYFNWQQMEFYGNLNLMKTGLVFADAINTVSQRYAEEIQSAPLGCGLEGVLQMRRDVLSGIINGVDYREWNPATDRYIAQKYDASTVHEGKPACKAALQQEFGLPREPGVPLLGFVGRLADQKGVDLIVGTMQEWVRSRDAQWVLLGTGEPKHHQALTQLAERFPDKVAIKLAFSNEWAHKIEAGADMFLMPSQYEPCGLNQLYSLKYGTVPVVRATGGLVDTICSVTPETIEAEVATGFSFRDYSTLALSETLSAACELYYQPEVWRSIVRNGMLQDWSWTRSAQDYVGLYQRTINRTRRAVLA